MSSTWNTLYTNDTVNHEPRLSRCNLNLIAVWKNTWIGASCMLMDLISIIHKRFCSPWIKSSLTITELPYIMGFFNSQCFVIDYKKTWTLNTCLMRSSHPEQLHRHLCQLTDYFTMYSLFFNLCFLFQLLNTHDCATLLLNCGKQLWNYWRHNTIKLQMNNWKMAVWSWNSIHPSCQDFLNLKSHMLLVNIGK